MVKNILIKKYFGLTIVLKSFTKSNCKKAWAEQIVFRSSVHFCYVLSAIFFRFANGFICFKIKENLTTRGLFLRFTSCPFFHNKNGFKRVWNQFG